MMKTMDKSVAFGDNLEYCASLRQSQLGFHVKPVFSSPLFFYYIYIYIYITKTLQGGSCLQLSFLLLVVLFLTSKVGCIAVGWITVGTCRNTGV